MGREELDELLARAYVYISRDGEMRGLEVNRLILRKKGGVLECGNMSLFLILVYYRLDYG